MYIHVYIHVIGVYVKMGISPGRDIFTRNLGAGSASGPTAAAGSPGCPGCPSPLRQPRGWGPENAEIIPVASQLLSGMGWSWKCSKKMGWSWKCQTAAVKLHLKLSVGSGAPLSMKNSEARDRADEPRKRAWGAPVLGRLPWAVSPLPRSEASRAEAKRCWKRVGCVVGVAIRDFTVQWPGF